MVDRATKARTRREPRRGRTRTGEKPSQIVVVAERAQCPTCKKPVDLVDLFGVIEMRLDPAELVADELAQAGAVDVWRIHRCRQHD